MGFKISGHGGGRGKGGERLGERELLGTIAITEEGRDRSGLREEKLARALAGRPGPVEPLLESFTWLGGKGAS